MASAAFLFNLLPNLVFSLAFTVVVGVLSRGRPRLLGVIAGGLSMLAALVYALIPLLIAELDVEVMSASWLGLVGRLISLASQVLIAIALIIGGRATVRHQTAAGVAHPYGGGPAPQSWPPQR